MICYFKEQMINRRKPIVYNRFKNSLLIFYSSLLLVFYFR